MASPVLGGSKSEGVKQAPQMKASGGGGGDSRGGSSRSYPKGGSTPGNSQSADFNPQKTACTEKYVGGV